MDKPKKKQVRPDPYFPNDVCPVDKNNVIYNQAYDEMDTYREYQLNKLADEGEIAKVMKEVYVKAGTMTITYDDFVDALAKRIRSEL